MTTNIEDANDGSARNPTLTLINDTWSGELSGSLPPFLEKLKNVWNIEIQESIECNFKHELIGTLKSSLSLVDLAEPTGERDLMRVQIQVRNAFLTVSKDVTKIIYSGRRHSTTSRSLALQRKHAIMGFLLLVENLSSLEFDTSNKMWHSKVENQNKEVHGDRDVGTLLQGSALASDVVDRIKSGTRLTELAGDSDAGKSSEVYHQWIGCVLSLVEEWKSGAIDDTETILAAKELRRSASGGGQSLDQIRAKYPGRDLNALLTEFEDSYLQISQLMGAIAEITFDEERGKVIATEQRERYWKKSRYQSLRSSSIDSYDIS